MNSEEDEFRRIEREAKRRAAQQALSDERNFCPRCGLVRGMHGSILPGCMCPFNDLTSLKYKQTVGPIESAMRERVLTDANGRKYITTEQFKPDWDAMAVMVEEQQRMAKRIEGLEALLERQTARDVEQQKTQAITALKAALEQQQAEPPPEWPLIKNILDEYGLDAISFVAEWKAAQRPWVGLTDEDWGWVADRKGTSLDTFDQGAVWAANRLKERNNE
jgi:RNA polymerase subunit RPABC4/transcription elongation factor Spt4